MQGQTGSAHHLLFLHSFAGRPVQAGSGVLLLPTPVFARRRARKNYDQPSLSRTRAFRKIKHMDVRWSCVRAYPGPVTERELPAEAAVLPTPVPGSGPGCPEQACKRWKSYLNGKLPMKSDLLVFLERLYIAEEYGNL